MYTDITYYELRFEHSAKPLLDYGLSNWQLIYLQFSIIAATLSAHQKNYPTTRIICRITIYKVQHESSERANRSLPKLAFH